VFTDKIFKFVDYFGFLDPKRHRFRRNYPRGARGRRTRSDFQQEYLFDLAGTAVCGGGGAWHREKRTEVLVRFVRRSPTVLAGHSGSHCFAVETELNRGGAGREGDAGTEGRLIG